MHRPRVQELISHHRGQEPGRAEMVASCDFPLFLIPLTHFLTMRVFVLGAFAALWLLAASELVPPFEDLQALRIPLHRREGTWKNSDGRVNFASLNQEIQRTVA